MELVVTHSLCPVLAHLSQSSSMFVLQMAFKTIKPCKSVVTPLAFWPFRRHAILGRKFRVPRSDVFLAIPTLEWEHLWTPGALNRLDLVPPLSSAGACQFQYPSAVVAARGNARAHPRRAVLHREGERCRRRLSQRLLNVFQGGSLGNAMGDFAHVVYERRCCNCWKTKNCVGSTLRRLPREKVRSQRGSAC